MADQRYREALLPGGRMVPLDLPTKRRRCEMFRFMLVGLLAIAMSGFWVAEGMAQRDAGAKARGDFGRFWDQGRASQRERSYYVQPMQATEQAVRSFSYEPARFMEGDEVVVAGQDVRMMVGRDVIGNMPDGLHFRVVKVVDGWLGAIIEVDGQQMKGWVRNTNVRSANEGASVEQPQEMRRFSYEPAQRVRSKEKQKYHTPPEVRQHPGVRR